MSALMRLRSRSAARRASERGSMAVEIVILTPVLMMFVLLVVAFGRYVGVKGDVEASARDAVRAASFERSYPAAQAAARSIAGSSLDESTTCSTAQVVGNWTAGGEIEVQLRCEVSYAGLGLIGLPGAVSVDASSAAPLDPYRSYQ